MVCLTEVSGTAHLQPSQLVYGLGSIMTQDCPGRGKGIGVSKMVWGESAVLLAHPGIFLWSSRIKKRALHGTYLVVLLAREMNWWDVINPAVWFQDLQILPELYFDNL